MHQSVLSQELIEALNVKKEDIIVDATVNGGGHSKKIAELLGKEGMLLGIDADGEALKEAKKRLAGAKCRVELVEANFRTIDEILKRLDVTEVDGIVMDLGMSSNQLEGSGRGFSFKRDEPLLMTFKHDPEETDLTAREIVNEWDEENLADIIFGYGEEQFARRIARAITRERREKLIATTKDLVQIIEEAVPKWYRFRRIHSTTRTFQALRIAVNDEIESLREGLAKGIRHLRSGGRIAVISFHSIEDRVVKIFFAENAREGLGSVVTKKPISPTREEIAANPRARSAKLRIFKRV